MTIGAMNPVSASSAQASMTDRRPATLLGMLACVPQEAVAIVFEGVELTYAQLLGQVGSAAARLERLGLQEGDVLGIWMPNTPRWLILHLACASVGIATLSLNLKLGVKEVVNFIDRAGCKALAFDQSIASVQEDGSLQRVWQQHAGSLQALIDASRDPGVSEQDCRARLESVLKKASHSFPRMAAWSDLQSLVAERIPGDVKELAHRRCIILSSSGTTSLPKLIVHSQSNVALHAQDVAPGFAVDGRCSVLLAIPMCGAFGYTAAMATLAAGAKLVVHEAFDPAAAVDVLARQPITHMFGTNDMVDKMTAPLAAGWRPKALRFFGHANFVPGLDEVPARAQALGIPMVGCFGMSEIFALYAHQDPAASLPRRAQAGGFPVTSSARVRVRSVETGELAAPMEPGELEFLAPYVMQEYLGDAQATAKVFTEDGFLRSGDLGYVNGDGGFTHISRLGDVLRIGGFLVNPAEIEEAVLNQTGAAACQVVAVSASGGSRPVAFVIPSAGQAAIDQEAVKAQLQEQIARYKVPIRIFSVDSFPYTASPNGMKVKRNELRDFAQSLLAQEEVR